MASAPRENTLWYKSPAKSWTQALPLGNGRIGAMVYGGVSKETLCLNEDTLWSGTPLSAKAPDVAAHTQAAAWLALAGQYGACQRAVERHLLGPFTQSYLPLGSLHLDFGNAGKAPAQAYRRGLCLDTATAFTEYTQNGVRYHREAFVSAPANALVLRLTADTPGALNFTAGLSCQLRHSVSGTENRLALQGICPSHVDPAYLERENPILYADDDAKKGISFLVLLEIETEGGTVAAAGESLRVCGANAAVLRLCVQTSFAGFNKHPHLEGKPYQALCQADMERAAAQSYMALRAAHAADYGALFNRTALRLGPARDDLPTNQRLARGCQPDDTGLFALLFQYGRYLLIASSRPGSQPANLQGIWNPHLRAPWSSNYTLNINTQMNYWPAESCNLAELHTPLFGLLQTLAATGAETARACYGAGGFVAHHNTDIWGLSNPVGMGQPGAAAYAFWPMGAGWLCRHVFEHYEYSLDEDFLKNTAWPLIKEAARFYLDVLTPDGAGHLIFCPSTSPENQFFCHGAPCAVAKTATMTTAILRETLENAVRCCRILGCEPDFCREAENALARLPPYAVGSKGQLLEWNAEFEECEPQHRHTSHLYPLYPGRHVRPGTSPALADACRESLRLRGPEGTGWALAWRVNLWARLGDGDAAFAFLKNQLRLVEDGRDYGQAGGSYANLFGAHPPFQIDSNFGAAAGMAEMLLQSGDGEVCLLPALPAAFPNGYVRGLRAKGGLTVDIFFENGRLTTARLRLDAWVPAAFVVKYAGGQCPLRLAPGQEARLAPGDFGDSHR